MNESHHKTRSACIPITVFGAGLSPAAISLYGVFLLHRNAETGTAWPERTTMSRMSGVGRNSISGALAALENVGLLKRVGLKGKKGVIEFAVATNLPEPKPTELFEPTLPQKRDNVRRVTKPQKRDSVNSSLSQNRDGTLSQFWDSNQYKGTNREAPSSPPTSSSPSFAEDDVPPTKDELKRMVQPTTDEALAQDWTTFPVTRDAVIHFLKPALAAHAPRINGRAKVLTPEVVAGLYRLNRANGRTLDDKPLDAPGRLPFDVQKFANHVAYNADSMVSLAKSVGLIVENKFSRNAIDESHPPCDWWQRLFCEFFDGSPIARRIEDGEKVDWLVDLSHDCRVRIWREFQFPTVTQHLHNHA